MFLAQQGQPCCVTSSITDTIYINKNRYWWKVKLPGEAKIKARPLRPVGAKYATKDIGVARELATNLLHQALFYSQKGDSWECDGSVMSIVKAFCDYARNYYKDVDGNITTEAKRIEYATKPLVELYAKLPAEEFGIEIAKAATGHAHISTTFGSGLGRPTGSLTQSRLTGTRGEQFHLNLKVPLSRPWEQAYLTYMPPLS
ncbi:MAG: hypothetical protein ACYTFK_09170 [Planctomycetota bacterium]|jgi:hypothetical protein